MKIDQLSRVKQVLFFIAIALTVLISDAAMIYTPLLNDLYEAFPGQEGAMNLFVSLPSFVLIISSLIVPPVINKMGRKVTLLAALVLAVISGVAMSFGSSAWYLVGMNVLNAVAQGFVNVGAVIIITDYIAGEAYRAKITGWYCVGVSLGATVLPIIAGNLGINGWQAGFSAYWLFLLPLLLCIFFVPSDKAAGCVAAEAEEKTVRSKAPFGKRFILFSLLLIFYYSLNNSYTWYYSVYVDELALGDTAFAGLVGSACNFAGMLTGLVFATLLKAWKKRMAFVCYVVVAVGLALLNLFPSRVIALACSALLGGTIGLIYPFAFALCPAVCPAEKQNQAIAVVTAISGIGGLLAPYWVSFGMQIFGSYRAFLLGIAVLMAVVAAVEFISSSHDKVGETA